VNRLGILPIPCHQSCPSLRLITTNRTDCGLSGLLRYSPLDQDIDNLRGATSSHRANQPASNFVKNTTKAAFHPRSISDLIGALSRLLAFQHRR
jgi:hypothetical protein